MPDRIFFDGLNLGLKHGTGVATYTRVLARLTRDLGHETGLVYGRSRGVPRRPLTAEVSFFDEEAPLGLPALLSKPLWLVDHLAGLIGTAVKQVPRTGAVLTRPLGSRWVESDHIFAARNVFSRGGTYFALTNLRYRVSTRPKPGVFHWTYPLPLRADARANIYTIHDLVPLRLPYTTLDRKRYYLRVMRTIARRADHIVTVSEHSKRDIMNYLGVEESRITNTYEAHDIPEIYLSRPHDLVARELEGIFGLGFRDYFLFFGALEPKKNVGRIIQAYMASNVRMPLVIVSGASWAAEREVTLLDQIVHEDDREHKEKLRRRIRRFGYLSFPLLMILARGARGIVFPSLYEGFGLPVLEGMALGTPVITSRESALPEIAGDATLMVDPYDTEAIRNAIVMLAEDDGLAEELARRGLKQAKKFSSDIYRERLGRLYASLS
jgi:glycosyltransferase involved in cell wall biosynthesis